MSTLNPSQVAAWFREQATKYTEMAETIERDFGLKNTTSATSRASGGHSVPLFNSDSVKPSPQAIASVVGAGKLRVRAISEKLGGLPMDIISTVVKENPAMFEVGDRGWISVKPVTAQ